MRAEGTLECWIGEWSIAVVLKAILILQDTLALLLPDIFSLTGIAEGSDLREIAVHIL